MVEAERKKRAQKEAASASAAITEPTSDTPETTA